MSSPVRGRVHKPAALRTQISITVGTVLRFRSTRLGPRGAAVPRGPLVRLAEIHGSKKLPSADAELALLTNLKGMLEGGRG